jgi:hypothetical protein
MAAKALRLTSENTAAHRILKIMQTNPGWVGLNMVIEEIAFAEGCKVGELEGKDFAPKGFISKFKNAANNARALNEEPRHGGRDNGEANKSPKVSLWTARTTVREMVFHYFERL